MTLAKIEEALLRVRNNLEDQVPEYQQNYLRAAQLFVAIKMGRFTFDAEPCFNTEAALNGQNASAPHELLLRARGRDDAPIAPLPAITAFKELGLGKELDIMLIGAMLDYAAAANAYPISVNITSSAVPRSEFWESLMQLIDNHVGADGPRKILFEIECNTLFSEDTLEAISEVKKHGFRIVVDDFDPNDLGRAGWDHFALLADSVKLKGLTTQAGLQGKVDLKELVQAARDAKADIELVGKWVETPEEALRLLNDFGITGAQGRHLPQTVGEFTQKLGSKK